MKNKKIRKRDTVAEKKTQKRGLKKIMMIFGVRLF